MASLALTCLLPSIVVAEDEPRELLVFAAASLTDVLEDLADQWRRESNVPVKLAFAASSVLARQIEAGGKADVFVSADEAWMDYLAQRALIEPGTRHDLVSNRLALIAPADDPVALEIAPGLRLADALGRGRLSIADPDTVPAGRYARSALQALGVWDEIRPRLARADNVRAALIFVSRGETPLGIVYQTDALIDRKVRIVGLFPRDTHPPIHYPAAAVRGARREARAFLDFLAAPAARDTWRQHGFLEIGP